MILTFKVDNDDIYGLDTGKDEKVIWMSLIKQLKDKKYHNSSIKTKKNHKITYTFSFFQVFSLIC